MASDHPPRPAEPKRLTVAGMPRRYLVFEPAESQEPLPLVLVFHGGGGSARHMEHYSRFNHVADQHGFLVVYPEALGANWNDGRRVEFHGTPQEPIDDVRFTRALLDDVSRQHNIDRGRVFASGFSNGGFFSHRLAAEASDLVAAIAPVAGGMAPAVAEMFEPRDPVSLLVIQGDADPLVPIAGGDVHYIDGRPRGHVISTAQTLEKYRNLNGSRGEPTIDTLATDSDRGTSVEIVRYPDGPGGEKTHYWLVKNGGHAWPGRPGYLAESRIGKACQQFSASDVIWDFFQSCPPRR